MSKIFKANSFSSTCNRPKLRLGFLSTWSVDENYTIFTYYFLMLIKPYTIFLKFLVVSATSSINLLRS
jgi:hypothetical protein